MKTKTHTTSHCALEAWTTVNQLAAMPEVPFTVGAIRMQIARAEQNGLAPCIRRVGRRVVINLPGYFDWIDGGAA